MAGIIIPEQEMISLGESRIRPRETYTADPKAIQNQYMDRVRSTNQLVEALDGFGKQVGLYEKKQQEELLKQTESEAAVIRGAIDRNAPVLEQISRLRPDMNPVLRAAVAETLGNSHGTTEAQKFIESLTPEIANDPSATEAAFAKKLAEEAKRLQGQNWYRNKYVDAMSAHFKKRMESLSSERTRKMTEAYSEGHQERLINRGREAYNTATDGESFSSPNLSIRYSYDRNAEYGRSASANAQKFANIVLHHAVGSTESLVKYGQRVDPQRGGSFGYHFYIDPDGTIVQGAPMSKRTNHVKAEGAPQRREGFSGVSNNNSIGITLVNAHRGHTPQQEEALKKLVPELQKKFGIEPARIYGHGELQSDRMSEEGKLARILRNNAPAPSGPPAASPTASTGDFSTTVAAAAKAAGVPEALIPFAVAQAGLESAEGKSALAKTANNLFGIKASSTWTGDRVTKPTNEVVNGQRVRVQAAFRKYASVEESVRDWWKQIQQNYPKTASAKTIEEAVAGLYQGRLGNYATEPQENYLRLIKSKVANAASLRAYGALPPQPPASETAQPTEPRITPIDPRVFYPPEPGNQEAPLSPGVAAIRQSFMEEDAKAQRLNILNRGELADKIVESAISLAKQANNGLGNVELLRAVPPNLLNPTRREKLIEAGKAIFQFQVQQINAQYTERQRARADQKIADEIRINESFIPGGKPLTPDELTIIGKRNPDLIKGLAERRTAIRNMVPPDESSDRASRLKNALLAEYVRGVPPETILELDFVKGERKKLNATDDTSVVNFIQALRKEAGASSHEYFKSATRVFLIQNYGITPEGLESKQTSGDPANPAAMQAAVLMRRKLIEGIAKFSMPKQDGGMGRAPSTEQDRERLFDEAAKKVLKEIPSTTRRDETGKTNKDAQNFQKYYR